MRLIKDPNEGKIFVGIVVCLAFLFWLVRWID
jgi:hypothetical protein